MAEWICRNAASRFRVVRDSAGDVIVKRVELGGANNLYAISFVMAGLALFVGVGLAALVMHRSNEAQANAVA
ncbi:MAG: hypothetical protein HY542_00310 [Deltaproteobacteria bacterium]|nr:hypothetical protein [Deltaproteobacteria bacterium]